MPASEIRIYTSAWCGYCSAAKRLLASKGATWEEIDVTNDPDARREMLNKSNGLRTVPQIFINGEHIGGFDRLQALDAQGLLDEKLFPRV